MFLGIIKAVPEGSFTHDYILLDGAGFIRTFTERVTDYFGSTPGDIERYHIHISDWIENFEDVATLMQNERGYRLQLDFDTRIVDLNCTKISTVIAGQSVTIIKLTESGVHERLAASHEVNSIKTEMPMNFYVDASKLKKEKKVAGKVVKEERTEVVETRSSTVDKPRGNGDKKARQDRTKTESMKSAIRKSNKTSDHSSNSMSSSNDKSRDGIQQPKENTTRKLSINSNRPSDVERQSQHKSIQSQTTSTMNRMMRATFSKRIERTSHRLRIMRKLLLLIFAVTCAFAIILNVVYDKIYKDYLQSLDHMSQTGLNYVNSVYLIETVRRFKHQRDRLSQEDRNARKAEIIQMANDLSDSHFRIFEHASYLPTDDESVFTEPTLNVAHGNATLRLSLNDAINALTSRASLVATRLADTREQHVDQDIIVISSLALDTLEVPLRQLSNSFFRYYQNSGRVQVPKIYAFTLVPMATLYLLCFIMIIAIFIKTNDEAKIVYKLFLDVPKVCCVSFNQDESNNAFRK